MENTSGSSTFSNFTFSGIQNPATNDVPFQFIFPSHAGSTSNLPMESQQVKTHHHRSASDSFLIEQPLWLDELLSEPEVITAAAPLALDRRGHQRSSSDSDAFLDSVAESFRKDSIKPDYIIPGTSQESHWSSDCRIVRSASTGKLQDKQGKEKIEGSLTKHESCKGNPSASRTDPKRAKQQFAQHSRLRKLEYISELERTVQILQAEGSEFSAALKYVQQQTALLGMENQALKQRLHALSQEKLIKHLEHEMLESEVARLQFLYHQQQLQQQQQQPQLQKKQGTFLNQTVENSIHN